MVDQTAANPAHPARPARRNGLAVAGGLIAGAVIAVVLDAVIAAIAHAAGASPDFQALQLPAFAFFTIVGIAAGAGGWAIVRARAADPRALLSWLAPVVLVVSFVPDVLVGVSGALPGSSWGAVAALMVMHVVVAAVAVATYLRVLPLPATRR